VGVGMMDNVVGVGATTGCVTAGTAAGGDCPQEVMRKSKKVRNRIALVFIFQFSFPSILG